MVTGEIARRVMRVRLACCDSPEESSTTDRHGPNHPRQAAKEPETESEQPEKTV